MPDDLSKKHPHDSGRISLTEPYEVAYWTQALGVTKAELEQAVKAVGHSAAAVRAYLARRRK